MKGVYVSVFVCMRMRIFVRARVRMYVYVRCCALECVCVDGLTCKTEEYEIEWKDLTDERWSGQKKFIVGGGKGGAREN